jgi:formamidopyrimidine-DNA glycosylase
LHISRRSRAANMPELPEVETVRRGLAPVMEGKRFLSVDQRRPDLRFPFPERFVERLTGTRVERLRRRSKYILADLGSGETLLMHLGMSGRLLIDGARTADMTHDRAAPGKHDHVIFDMEGGVRIAFNDARRFGSMDLLPTDGADAHRLLANIGPEPLGNDFHADLLAARFAGRKTSVKTALLDQRIVAGLGNIYVCEALWRAGIAPDLLVGTIARDRLETLAQVIRDVLTEAIAAGGSSLRDYRQADGELGYFQHGFAVYGREGKPCKKSGCGGTIDRLVQSARSTFHCPRCQR